MSNFKSGDKVIYIEGYGCDGWKWRLLTGNEYIVNKTKNIGSVPFVSVCGVGKDDTEFFSSRFVLAEKIEFNIDAHISRQFTRNHREAVLILDSGLDIDFPLSVYFKDYDSAISYSRKGKCVNGSSIRETDLVTRSEIKPDVISYIAVSKNTGSAMSTSLVKPIAWSGDYFCWFVSTYNPNTFTLKTEPFIN